MVLLGGTLWKLLELGQGKQHKMQQWEEVLADPDDPSKGTMLQANYTPRTRGNSWMRHYLCATCGLEYRADEVSFVDGKPYCLRLGHADEAIAARR